MAQNNPSKRGLLMGFVIIIVFMVLIAVVGLSRMLIISDDIDHIVLSHNVKSELVKQMRNSARERSILLHSMAVENDHRYRRVRRRSRSEAFGSRPRDSR